MLTRLGHNAPEICLRRGLKGIAVGTPVARGPPHRSRRAVFPHRALQDDSLTHSLTRRPVMRPKQFDLTGLFETPFREARRPADPGGRFHHSRRWHLEAFE